MFTNEDSLHYNLQGVPFLANDDPKAFRLMVRYLKLDYWPDKAENRNLLRCQLDKYGIDYRRHLKRDAIYTTKVEELAANIDASLIMTPLKRQKIEEDPPSTSNKSTAAKSSNSITPSNESPPVQEALPIDHDLLRSLIEKHELRRKPISNTPNERHWEDKKEYDRDKAIQYRVERFRGLLD